MHGGTGSPTDRIGTRVDGVEVLGALSPSRAGDFLSCPLQYRFRTVDRLPEEPSVEALRGTVVHKVLEDLFDLPAAERTRERAVALLRPSWEAIADEVPELRDLFDHDLSDRGVVEDAGGTEAGGTEASRTEASGTGSGLGVEEWLDGCRDVLVRYFGLEDPRRLEPAERELYVEALLESRLLLRGFVDRIDVAPDGRVRVVDYKTGRSPSEGYEGRALFQMRFYALVWWRTRGVVPTVLQLVYLGNGEVLRYSPDEQDLLATQRKVEAIWRAIRDAEASGEWLPRPSRLCSWCSFQSICPAFGGTPPPLPVRDDSPTLPASADAVHTTTLGDVRPAS